MIFHKTSTSGNDFLIVDRGEFDRLESDKSEFTRIISSREKADGVIFYSKTNNAVDFQIINSDGSSAEISGNGMAGLASVLFSSGKYRNKIQLKTTAGVRYLHLIDKTDSSYKLQVDMGLPEFNEVKFFPFLTPGKKEYEYNGTRFYPVSTGNPHAVVILDDDKKDHLELEKTGREIESGDIFPMRTNVEFVFPVKYDNNKNKPLVRAFFYERGAGVTRFSSTGTTAVFSVLNTLGIVGDSMLIQTEEGTVSVYKNEKIFIESTTRIVYKGEYQKD